MNINRHIILRYTNHIINIIFHFHSQKSYSRHSPAACCVCVDVDGLRSANLTKNAVVASSDHQPEKKENISI